MRDVPPFCITFFRMKETIRCQRSANSDKDWAVDRAKEYGMRFYFEQGDTYCPDCA